MDNLNQTGSRSKVAAIQMCSSHSLQENLAAAKNLIKEAQQNQAKLIVLPENFAMMARDAGDRLKVKESLGTGEIQDFLSSMALENKVWLVGGTISLATEDPNKVWASCLFYNDQGKQIARYDKIHLFDAMVSETEIHQESRFVEAGKQALVVDTPFGKVGLAVCFDVRFPHLFNSLAAKGAEIIVLPSAFTYKTGNAHWEILTRCRAIDTFSYLIGAAQGGTHTNGRKTYGHSLIVGPWGEVLAEKEDLAPGVIYAEVDLEYLQHIRKAIPLKPSLSC